MVHDRRQINFLWLIRLRWAAIAGQLITIAVTRWALGVHLPLAALFGLVAMSAAVNVGCAVVAARGRPVSDAWLAATMAVDVLLFTGLLYFSGGPANPFSFLYLVYLALAAIVLPPRWTWALAVLSLAGSAVLFVDAHPVHVGSTHEQNMVAHLRGMWVALGVAAAFIVYFLLRVTRALADREQELSRARQLAERQERLASLATMAAGAAHELSTPLSTIATVVADMDRTAGCSADDVRLIRDELARCRSILAQMSADAGAMMGEGLATVSVHALLADAVDDTRAAPAIELDCDGVGDRRLRLPRRAVAQAIRSVIRNAQDATRGEHPVRVEAAIRDDRLALVVRDRGDGMTPEQLERAGEPFFTTKPPGAGMGLGLFLTRAVVERLGGALAIESSPGTGTTVAIELPVDAATNDRMARPG
ncbi:MAG: sensor histidine kinase [Deltaproteobacteria bacterium]|nr:MAG: sensor histidine kinase [Deltaproteobacteria bacterium]